MPATFGAEYMGAHYEHQTISTARARAPVGMGCDSLPLVRVVHYCQRRAIAPRRPARATESALGVRH